MSVALLNETYVARDNAVPPVAPRWFDCFDAVTIGHAQEQGDVIAFLGQKEIHQGVDRVIAVFPNDRVFSWHQLNERYAE
ncbi:MAG: hypothetical protein GY945_04960 [Rhodobacteraceae bacterium]|nr:hypothetical protein [Paracoccaceae bacterium]